MNGVPDSVDVKLKQTSKGVWYCDGFSVCREKFLDVVSELDAGMTEIEKILEKHNKEAE